MNKRIRELAEQCWDKRPEGQLHFDNEKFAELIVRECIAHFYKNAEHDYLGAGSKLSAFNIKEHFGVES